MSGFITIQRKLLEWEWYKDKNAKSLFIHCLIKANWEDKNWKGITIKRGDFITSIDTLCSELNLSIREVRTAISNLQKTNEIIKKATNKYTLLTVVKYDIYQKLNTDETNQRQTKDKPKTTTNNNNNNNNIDTIESRKLKFAQTLVEFVNDFDRKTLVDFYNYWSENNLSNTKFRKELQKTWNTKLRLKKWNSNNFNKTNTNGKFTDLFEVIRSDGSGKYL
jgi:hypothetical protein